MNNNNTDTTALCEFVLSTFKDFSTNRKQLLEGKWQRNINAYKKINNGKWKDEEGKDWRSKTYIGITKQKIVAAYSIVIDTLLQGGKIPFLLKLSQLSNQQLEDMPEENRLDTEHRIELMTARIQEQFADCNADRQMMKHALAAAIYGETYAKRSVHEVIRRGYQPVQDTMSQSGQHERWEPFEQSHDAPCWEYLSCWDVFRDIESDDIQDAAAIIHRQYVSPYELRNRADDPYYIKEKIDHAVSDNDEGNDPEDTSSMTPGKREIAKRKKKICLLEFWGRVPRSVAEEFEAELDQGREWSLSDLAQHEDNGDDVEIMCVLANKHIVRYVRLDEKQRPFYRAVWENDLDSTGGIGVADNLEDVQTIFNGSIRAFEDNKKLASNVILALKKRMLAKNIESVKPGMLLDLAEECDDARQAVQQVVISDVGQSLMSMIELASGFADDDSNIPRVQQGQSGNGNETAFELSQRLEKSGKYLGSVIRNFDEGLIEPITGDFLEFNMEDPEADGKGNFQVQANGFTSFQNRITRIAAMRQLLELVMSSEELRKEVKYEDIFKEFATMLDVDPDAWLFSEEEKATRAEAEQKDMELRQQTAELELASKQADIELTQAKAQEATIKSQVETERLKLDQVNAMQENKQNKENVKI